MHERDPFRLRVIASAVLLLLVAAGAGAVEGPAQPERAAGRWDGAIEMPGMELGIRVELEHLDDGGWRGTIDIPLQNAEDLALEEIEVEGDAVRFKIAGVPGDPSFDGMLSEDGTTLAGTFRQSGQQLSFRLERDDVAPDQAPDAAAGDPLEDFDEFVERVREDWETPGVAVAVIRDGRLQYARGHGLRDVAGGLAVTEETLFPVGSTTKAFTATLAAMLVDEGRLEWDEPIRAYMPDFALHDELAAARLTLRDLLTHRSGLPRHDLAWYGTEASRAQLLGRLAHLESTHGFRSRFQYQNLMYMTAGYLAGHVARSDWESLVRGRLFDPLGMQASNLSIEALERAADRAVGYAERDTDGDGEEETTAIPYRSIEAVAPAGSINSNVVEMADWLLLQLDGGEFGGRRLVSEESLRELHTPQVVVPRATVLGRILIHEEMPHLMYGMGWFVQAYRGHELVHHAGNIDGFAALVSFMPRQRSGVVVLANTGAPFLPLVLTLGAYDRLLGLEPIDWHGRYRLLREQLRRAEEQERQGRDAGRRTGTKPSHDPAAYAGEYDHLGYGTLRVDVNGGGLDLRYNAIDGPLEHWHFDVFRVVDGLADGMKLTFDTNIRGDVAAVEMLLEPTADAIRFTRRPPAEMYERGFLERFVGEYSLEGVVCPVRLRPDGKLTVTVPGQPTYVLEPYRDTDFDLRGLTGYSVRFELDGGKATGMVFIQPNGIFQARRKD